MARHAALLAGIVVADVVVWRGKLINRPLAFSTDPELDKGWISMERTKARG